MSDSHGTTNTEVSGTVERFKVVSTLKKNYLATTVPLLDDDDVEDVIEVVEAAIQDWCASRSDAGHDLVVEVRAEPLEGHSPKCESEKTLFFYAEIPPEEGADHIIGAARDLTEYILSLVG